MAEEMDSDPRPENIRCRCRGHGAPEIIDPCIRELVDCLNRHGIKTFASCCGHGGPNGCVLIDAKMVEEWKDGMVKLHLKALPILVPYDVEKMDWIEWSGDHYDWYERKPYCKKSTQGESCCTE